MSNLLNVDQELTDEQFRLIGVELRVNSQKFGTQELAMFSSSLILPRLRSAPGVNVYDPVSGYVPNVTIHTTLGDYTFGGYDYANW